MLGLTTPCHQKTAPHHAVQAAIRPVVQSKGIRKGFTFSHRALRKSGYQDEILFQSHATHTRKKTRKRSIAWFNPPFSESV